MPGTVCFITGTIKDSGGYPVSGKLVITLDGNLSDQTTNPDSLLVGVPKEYIITNGVIDDPAVTTPIGIGLLESATQEITYFFQFYRLISVGVYDTKTLIDFHEIVPDVATAEFESLARETGITTTNLSTGALKVAREILVNPVLAQLVFYSSQIFKSATKPVSNINGTLLNDAVWIQPARGMTWRYDLARSKWKSTIFQVQVGIRNTTVSALGGILKQSHWVEFPTVIIERIDIRFYVLAAPNDVTNKWAIQAVRQTEGSDTLVTIGSVINTNGFAVGTNQITSIKPNASFAAIDLDTVGLQITKTGSPGNLTVSATFTLSYLDS